MSDLVDIVARAMFDNATNDFAGPVIHEECVNASVTALVTLRRALADRPALIAELGWQIRQTGGGWASKSECLFAPPAKEPA